MPGVLNVLDPVVLKADGCQLADPPQLFTMIAQGTGGDPCLTGCAYYEQGRCKAFQKHHSSVNRPPSAATPAAPTLVGGQWAGMSIKQIAEKENISLNEARKRKQAGRYLN